MTVAAGAGVVYWQHRASILQNSLEVKESYIMRLVVKIVNLQGSLQSLHNVGPLLRYSQHPVLPSNVGMRASLL
eukprot:CAMPEP_0119116600 /NCGR_PEP_ID=MMETSP1180-20130426/52380_1 /TAXON_ID=3052 ORGANISM="Chlamydomonas cf sp, Strain CCMP681" /NCGR_SAMPLE_ID=MMETSP1180 /ASSEMBLY_ACC=CAM_ASM_000741 /LENGTH=73 /DNA_ID=CAMNT_0007105771 /DNA_START=40 /DNA_END=261 /DNA_ORIENTATION=-